MESCTVYNAEKFKELLSGSEDVPAKSTRRGRSRTSSKDQGPKLTSKERFKRQLDARRALRNEEYWKEQDKLLKITEQRVKELVEKKERDREAAFQRNQKGVEDAQKMSRDIGEWLNLQDEMEYRKRLARYHEWEETYTAAKREVGKRCDKSGLGRRSACAEKNTSAF